MDKFLGKRLFRHSHILLRAAVCMYAVCTYAVFVYAVACKQYVNLLFVSMQCVECRGGRIANKFTNRKSTNCGKKSGNLRICDLRTESFYAICGFGICGHTFFADLKLMQISKYINSFLPKYGYR
jgi:hypothetical protein